MYNKRATNIKETQDENRRLQEETKRMQEELERVRKFKAMELQKQKLRIQMEQLTLQTNTGEQNKIKNKQIKKKKQLATGPNLRNYGQKVKEETEQKAKKKLAKIKVEVDSESEEDNDQDTENLKYFMDVVGFPKYFDLLIENKITTLGKLRDVNEVVAKQIGIPIKDMVKINKKLRSMGY